MCVELFIRRNLSSSQLLLWHQQNAVSLNIRGVGQLEMVSFLLILSFLFLAFNLKSIDTFLKQSLLVFMWLWLMIFYFVSFPPPSCFSCIIPSNTCAKVTLYKVSFAAQLGKPQVCLCFGQCHMELPWGRLWCFRYCLHDFLLSETFGGIAKGPSFNLLQHYKQHNQLLIIPTQRQTFSGYS